MILTGSFTNKTGDELCFAVLKAYASTKNLEPRLGYALAYIIPLRRALTNQPITEDSIELSNHQIAVIADAVHAGVYANVSAIAVTGISDREQYSDEVVAGCIYAVNNKLAVIGYDFNERVLNHCAVVKNIIDNYT